MFILRKRISSRHGHDVREKRWVYFLVLFKQMQKKLLAIQKGCTKTQMDDVLRQRGEGESLTIQNERTLLFIKPDGVVRGLMGEIINRIERKGLLITAVKLLSLNRARAEKFYEVHRGKPFFEALVRHVISGPILAMVVEGPKAISVVRHLIGKTSAFEAEPGTIRGDFGISVTKNIVHASDSIENAETEIAFFFRKREILRYEKATEKKFAL
jgi:nucleoside-diphosphate kinase